MMQSLSWIEPLLVAVESPAEAALAEQIRAIDLHRTLQAEIVLWLRTGQEGDAVEAILAELGVNPYQFWDTLLDSIEAMTEDQVQVTDLHQLDGYAFDLPKQPQLILPY